SDIQATGHILNDDTAPVVTIDAGTLDVSHNEGNSGTTAYVFTVNLSNASDKDVIINYSTADGTATVANGDYQGASGQLTILAGQTSGTITVLGNGDTTFEGDEAFTLSLDSVTGGTLGASDIQATGHVLND